MGKISSIYTIILKAIEATRTPPPEIPSVLLLSGAKLRPGLSPITIASKIIARQEEAGAPTGVLPSGEKNVSELMEVIRVEEIINAILTDAMVDVVISPGVPVTASGSNAGGPVVCVGTTTNVASGKGIIR